MKEGFVQGVLGRLQTYRNLCESYGTDGNDEIDRGMVFLRLTLSG
jgi:hypothetical protein